MHASVVLIHTLPDGSSHYDWLIDQPELDSTHRLISFRCQTRPDSPGSTEFYADRLPDHRVAYLTYEGAVSNNRGSVERIASGVVIALDQSSQSLSILIQWSDQSSDQPIRYQAKQDQADQDPASSTRWKIHQHSPNSPLDA